VTKQNNTGEESKFLELPHPKNLVFINDHIRNDTENSFFSLKDSKSNYTKKKIKVDGIFPKEKLHKQ